MTTREPVTIVELDQDFCSLTYGEGSCRATKTNQSKPQRRSIFSTDISPDNNANSGLYWRNTEDAAGHLNLEHPRPGMNIFSNSPGDSTSGWVLPNAMFSDPTSNAPFLFYRLSIDSPTAAEDVNPFALKFHRRFYVNLSENGTFSHVVQQPSIKDDLLDDLYLAIRNNETGEEAVAFFGDDLTEPYRFTFNSRDPMSLLLDNVSTGDSMTYVIGRKDRRDFNSASLTVNRGTSTFTQAATGSAECYNTFHTCQDQEAFLKGVKTLRFKFPDAAEPLDLHDAFPCLQSVSSVPTRINVAGLDRVVSPFGRRAKIKIVFQDFDYNDARLDPYGRTPAGGTFWTRWKARNRHYLNRPVRVYEGEARQNLSEMDVRHYLIERIDGPDVRGRVTISAKDVLRFADDKAAVVPKPSKGRLEGDITETATSLTLSPSGIGREYGYGTTNAGFIRIGSEVMAFTRSNGSDDLTITRARENTEAKAHKAGDVVQQCKVYEYANQLFAHEVLYDLLVNEADVDSTYIDRNEWWAEGNVWLQAHRLSLMITKPEGIAKMIGEITQTGVTIWWDERAKLIRLLPVRPETPEEVTAGYPHFTDDNAILEYPKIKEKPEARLTRFLYYHHMVSPVESVTEAGNFERLQIGVNLNAERAIEYGEQQNAIIYNRWLHSQDAGLISGIIQRALSRYEHPPIEVEITVPVSLTGGAWTGDRVSLASRSLPSLTGAIETKLWQIISAEMKKDMVTYILREAAYPLKEVELSGIGDAGSEDTVDEDDPALPIEGSRYAYIVANNHPTYANASEAQRNEQRGGWIADNDYQMADDTAGYKII